MAEGLEPDFASRGPRVSKLDLQLYDLVLDIALEDFRCTLGDVETLSSGW